MPSTAWAGSVHRPHENAPQYKNEIKALSKNLAFCLLNRIAGKAEDTHVRKNSNKLS